MSRKGFTLVELLFVLVIIGIIIALLIPNAMQALRTAAVKECATNIRTIDGAIQMCYAKTRDWESCASQEALRTGGYMPPEVTDDLECPIDAALVYDIDTSSSGVGLEVVKGDHFTTWPSEHVE